MYLIKMSNMTKQYIVRNSSNKADTILAIIWNGVMGPLSHEKGASTRHHDIQKH